MEMEDGAVTSVEGGWAADKISRVWSEYDDPASTTSLSSQSA